MRFAHPEVVEPRYSSARNTLAELWVENRVMLEIVTEDMLPAYVQIANGRGQAALLAGKAARAT
jgi:hypothetical protein